MFLNVDLPGVVTTVSASAIIFIYYWLKRNGSKDAGKRSPPSASVLSLVGAVLRNGMNFLPEHFMRSAEKLGPVISYKLGGSMMIILNGKEAIKEAFLRHSEAFSDRAELWTETSLLNRKLKGIIFARYNDAFKKNHKLCLSILKEFGFGVSCVSETRILREVECFHEKILKLNGRQFDPKELLVLTTFNVTSSILFGREFVASDSCEKIADGVTGFAKNYEHATGIAPFLRFLPYFRKKFFLVMKYHEDMINGIREGIERSKSAECETTFVRRFIEIQGTDYNREDLLYIVRDLCMGSAETASTTIQWAIVELANHPEVQIRFQKEIDEMVPKDRLPSLDDKPRLPYTEAVILEIWRKRTTIPFFVPHQTLRDTEVYGLHIPKGCVVLANAISAHMDQKYWKDPENFRPERFLNEDNVITGNGDVIPFGMGKRSCLGEILGRQKVFLILTSLVQRFDIRPPEGEDSIDVKEIIRGAMHPTDFKVRLIPRSKIVN